MKKLLTITILIFCLVSCKKEIFKFLIVSIFTPMKKLPFIFFLLISHVSYLTSFSQTGQSKIVLKDKSEIKNIRVWNFYSNKIEYEENGSLHDLLTEHIFRIETDTTVLSFDEPGQLYSRPYDWIIKPNNDTVFCIISQLGGNYIYYYPKGKDNRNYLPESTVKKYQVYKPELLRKLEPSDSPGSQGLAPDTLKVREKESTPISVESPVIQETIQKKEERIDTIAEIKEVKSDLKNIEPSPIVSSDFCYESYLRGEEDAEKRKEGLWGVGGFCLSGCLSPISLPSMTLIALTTKDPVNKFPDGVDEKCYTLGYQNQQSKKRVYNTAVGGLISSVIMVAALYVLFIGRAGGQ